jgi:hypothetical protein
VWDIERIDEVEEVLPGIGTSRKDNIAGFGIATDVDLR